MRNIFKRKQATPKLIFGDHNPPCTCHGPADDMREIQVVWGGDVDWGTSNSDCAHRNFPCEYCGVDVGVAFKEQFSGITTTKSLPTGDFRTKGDDL